MVKWTADAKQDLKQLYDYIARDSIYYAQKVSQDIVTKTEALKNFPEIGKIVPEIGDSMVRELLVYSYRLIYEITHKDILILAIIHGKRLFKSEQFK